MTSVENLSDAEIRLKLAELGFPVGPITATTRKTLVKKLKNLLDKSGSKSYKSLAKYSSEEESEDDTNTAGRSKRSMPPPPVRSAQKNIKRKSVRRSQDFEGPNDLEENSVSEFEEPTASSTFYTSGDNLKAGIVSQKYSPKNIVSPPNDRPATPERKSVSTTFQSRFFKHTVNKSPETLESGSDTDGLDEIENLNKAVNSSPARPASTGLFSAFKPSVNSPALSQSRSRFQPQSYGNSKPEIFSPRLGSISGSNNDSNNHASPFSSDFARRLSVSSPFRQSIGAATSGGLSSRLLDVKESDDEEGNSRPSYPHQSPGNLKRGTSVPSEGKIFNGSSISIILLSIVTIFFCFLAVMYMNAKFKDTEIITSDANFPICKGGDKPGSTCIVSSEVAETMEMFRHVYGVLHDRAVRAACGGSGVDQPALSQEHLSQIIVEQKQLSLWDVEKYFGNIRVLIEANPQWGVRIEDNKFSVPEPNLPFSCVALNIVYGIVGSVVRLVVGLAVVAALAWAVYWWMERRQQSRKEVFRLVESIIDILSSSSDQFLAISHVRDQLIPPQQREKMSGVWSRAVAYLEENESRVRTEVQQVRGEEFSVWRWLAAPKKNGKRRVWQGQAFETMEGSVNSLAISPTPCLKIRHMFDSADAEEGDDWPVRVQDAVLEKCESASVLHVAVDRGSTDGCVYVKCATPADAGRAYRALHGSWFDGKLVTVKYLRLERYHERFPDAARCVRPLRPSNEHKLSLQ